MRVEWRPVAESDLAEIVQYIAAESPRAAYDIYERIRIRVAGLAAFPESGRPGRVENTRELVISGTPFLVAYRVTSETISVLSVIHGARRWPTSF